MGQLVKTSDGSIAAHYEYDPFGIELKSYGSKADDNPFRFSTKYFDTETGLGYWGYRYYFPELGRWISRDPIDEEGGLNLYGFVNNDPVNLWDILGLDFIAVADRAVGGTMGTFYHYSIQYWKTQCDVKLRKEMDVDDLKKIDKNASKLGSIELLRQAGWKVWAISEGGVISKKKGWKIIDTSISVIKYSDSSTNLAAIYTGDVQSVKAKWNSILYKAKTYDYAEQPSFNGSFMKWPNSKYQMPGDKPFNNSNTFIRYLVSSSGLLMIELGGSHPGANSPLKVPNIYGGYPWKEGQKAPSAPTTKP